MGLEKRIRILAGQYFDAETGLHYNYHRYYDPANGRYLTPDPFGLAGGINLFSYVGGNPVNLVDPFGLFEWKYFNGALASGGRLVAHGFFQPAIEGAGGIFTVSEVTESAIQRKLNRISTPADPAAIKNFAIHLLAFGGAEIAEMNYWALELLSRSAEDAYFGCDEKNYGLSDFFKKYRIKASDDSNELRDKINNFVSGGIKNETWITISRRINSDIGTINKSIIAEEFGKFLYNVNGLSNQ
ncbi:hypothetical protein DESC_500008 [Desulfosarcina cetonica]|uniref:RHS repeat-associated core domain-containing protein n=1 Tax=Desulfosarcina cetonica TaxID=90730 RepID=UPI0006D14940|nr:RHS repeat-associated core domain-containing protein [Desulfosarcina cetonica]VTR66624.1 hypothetical protein DESC_500008 [Desulfosarcina cetonica]